MYALGLLGDAERKSVEPIAARAYGEPELCRAYTERLLHFVVEPTLVQRGRLAEGAVAECDACGGDLPLRPLCLAPSGPTLDPPARGFAESLEVAAVHLGGLARPRVDLGA
jgi:hypothetical protein